MLLSLLRARNAHLPHRKVNLTCEDDGCADSGGGGHDVGLRREVAVSPVSTTDLEAQPQSSPRPRTQTPPIANRQTSSSLRVAAATTTSGIRGNALLLEYSQSFFEGEQMIC